MQNVCGYFQWIQNLNKLQVTKDFSEYSNIHCRTAVPLPGMAESVRFNARMEETNLVILTARQRYWSCAIISMELFIMSVSRFQHMSLIDVTYRCHKKLTRSIPPLAPTAEESIPRAVAPCRFSLSNVPAKLLDSGLNNLHYSCFKWLP